MDTLAKPLLDAPCACLFLPAPCWPKCVRPVPGKFQSTFCVLEQFRWLHHWNVIAIGLTGKDKLYKTKEEVKIKKEDIWQKNNFLKKKEIFRGVNFTCAYTLLIKKLLLILWGHFRYSFYLVTIMISAQSATTQNLGP